MEAGNLNMFVCYHIWQFIFKDKSMGGGGGRGYDTTMRYTSTRINLNFLKSGIDLCG